jgi:hypothetical protein
MPREPIKMPAPPLGPGQVEVKLGARRYVLNIPAVSPMCRELVGESPEPCTAHDGLVTGELRTVLEFHPNAFALVWPPIGRKPARRPKRPKR